ncbi:MAG: phosphoadenylyl-sulfate reductase, partial [Xanthomonadales bacterium]|nr:phosphoadenylyl-sulfate reductase [Xanthomonadales bacterium]
MSSLAIQATEPDLICANHRLAALDAAERVRWGLTHLPGPHVLTSSFGAQAAVMLHLVTREQPDIPVVLVDTGYLFPETYRFVDALTDRLKLNLHVCRPAHSAAWLEARHGRLWEAGREGLEHYNRISKVEPLQRTFEDLGVATWFAGLRREQSSSRRDLAHLTTRSGRYKLLP